MDTESYTLVSMDMSMRSSGLVALSSAGNLENQAVIKTSKDDFPDTEDLIIHITDTVMDFINSSIYGRPIKFVIEGLAFAGKSGHKDIIAGIYWGIRSRIHREFPSMLIGSIPVTTWRKMVLTSSEQKEAKATLTPKTEAIKKATVAKLPDSIKQIFLDYIDSNGYDKKSMYDLTDAYFMGKYRIGLDN